MLSLELNNIYHQIFLILLILFFLYLGWKLRKLYKNFIFSVLKFKGKKAEKEAVKLLEKNGFKILEHQYRMNGFILENGNKVDFFVQPDFLVSRDNKNYVAEVKTGISAFISERNTRRQLLEYSRLLNSKQVLLVDITRKKIKLIEF